MSKINQSLAELSKTAAKRAHRRLRSLGEKIDDLAERSPEVRRYMAYRKLESDARSTLQAAQADFTYWTLRDEGTFGD